VKATRLDWLGWLLIAAALPALGVVKINPVDVPWHLATARLAEATGHWPVRNTFSWTYPDHVLYQQYPVFQTILWQVWKGAGWPGLSLLLAVAWTGVLALFVCWAGGLRRAVPFHLAWALVAFSLQTRTSLRPDALSLTLLPLLLLILDGYRRRRALIALVPLVHWVWVNGHQLFVLSFAVQGLFLASLLLARRGGAGVERTDAPIVPVLLALAASAALSFLSPLGTAVTGVFAHTTGSVAHHHGQVQELARLWSDPTWLVIALASALPTALALVRSRRVWQPFEVGLWLLTLAMALVAIRGLVYFTLVNGAVLQRTLLRQPMRVERPFLRRVLRAEALALTAVLMTAIVFHRWIRPSRQLGGVQAGLGRSEGDWPDASVAAVKAAPPPGPMMNIPWSFANALIWDWPEQPVFVDPRFEAYPRPFLVQSMAALVDDGALDAQVARHRPGWIFAQHCTAAFRARIAHLAARGWRVTHADVQAVVLVPASPGPRFVPAQEPVGLGTGLRRARQRLCYARLLGALGYPDQARAQLVTTRAEAAGDEELRDELAAADREQRAVEQHEHAP
jgi:hypothetical protein